MTTVAASTAVTDLNLSVTERYGPESVRGSRINSKVKATSAAVIGSPSEKVNPGRKRNVTVTAAGASGSWATSSVRRPSAFRSRRYLARAPSSPAAA